MSAQQPDLLDMLAELDREPYAGPAPLHFSAEPFTVEELRAAEDEYRRVHGNFGIRVGKPHLWFDDPLSSSTATPGHPLTVMTADLRCGHDHLFLRDLDPPQRCSCVGGIVSRAHCGCGFVSDVFDDDGGAVRAWHDHAWPGWRDLPAVPLLVRPNGERTKKESAVYLGWIEAHYPAGWAKPGAPILTEREGIGTRCVPGYSPWGGYDISVHDSEGES